MNTKKSTQEINAKLLSKKKQETIKRIRAYLKKKVKAGKEMLENRKSNI